MKLTIIFIDTLVYFYNKNMTLFISIEIRLLTIIFLILVNSLIFYDILSQIMCIYILYIYILESFYINLGKIKWYIKFFNIFMDMLDILLEIFESGESPEVDTVIDDVELEEDPEDNIKPNQNVDDPEDDENKKSESLESDKDGEGKPNKGKDKADRDNLVSNKGDDNSNENEQNSDNDKNSDDEDDDDDVYIADCERRKQALIQSSKGASRIEKQRILDEFNVLDDMINNIKNNRN